MEIEVKDGDWYLMYRGWMDSKVFKKEPYTQREAWIWLIENALYVDKYTVDSKVNGGPIHLVMGQLTYSHSYLAKAWDWTPKRSQDFANKLKKWGMISTEVRQGQTVITISNYAAYQRKATNKGREGRSSEGREGVERGGDNNKEGLKKDKEGKKNSAKYYKFEGEVVKLTEEDYNRWKDLCPNLTDTEFRQSLTNADDFYRDNPKGWFFKARSWAEKDNAAASKRINSMPPVDTTIRDLYEERNKLFTASNFIKAQIDQIDAKPELTAEDEEMLNELATKWTGIEKRQTELQDHLSQLQRQ